MSFLWSGERQARNVSSLGAAAGASFVVVAASVDTPCTGSVPFATLLLPLLSPSHLPTPTPSYTEERACPLTGAGQPSCLPVGGKCTISIQTHSFVEWRHLYATVQRQHLHHQVQEHVCARALWPFDPEWPVPAKRYGFVPDTSLYILFALDVIHRKLFIYLFNDQRWWLFSLLDCWREVGRRWILACIKMK